MTAESLLNMSPVVPVITIERLEDAVPLAQALVNGGIKLLEVTLRTRHGLEAIRQISDNVEGAVVGAGTVRNVAELEAAIHAGSQFIITPGCTPALLAAGVQCGVPFLPGVATVSEMMDCADAGLDVLKFFPAESAGGVSMLRSFAGPFPSVKFCPTGGIGLSNMADYLSLSNVLCVGGSWLTPKDAIANRDWARITELAKQAIAASAA